MKNRLALVFAYFMLAGQSQPASEGEHLAENSTEFIASRDKTLKTLSAKGFTGSLSRTGLGAVSLDSTRQSAAVIKANVTISSISHGVPDKQYDVILQPGHYGRTSGATGAAGQLVSERDLNAFLVGKIASRLKAQGLNVLVVPADNVVANKAGIFLSVHAEGSSSPCKAGPSLAYKAGTSPFAMHSIGLATSQALGYQYKDFRADNYTKNSAEYYMYNRVTANKLTGLLEVGEITCPASEKKLVDGADRLAENLAKAIAYIHAL